MAKTDAVSSVTGDLFEKNWSRIRGGPGQGSRKPQMVRAARGNRAAVFKAIRSGGCHNRAQLANQLEYLTTKSSHIVDSRGVLDGKATLTGDEIASVADRFARRWSDGFHPKLGQTTHLLMSFPVGTKGCDVRDIASEVCARFFANDDRTFDYLIAVHEDRDHPHAHVVLNRKSQEGEFFYLGRDHHFNYDDFRIGMVEAAERYGVRLEATRRVERGVVEYAPRVREVYAAKAEGREAVGRARVGNDLAAVQAEVKRLGREYRRLGEGEKDFEPKMALVRAGDVLERGGRLESTGAVYAPSEPTAEDVKARFDGEIERIRARIDAATDAGRPALQKDMYAILRTRAERMPIGERPALSEPVPSGGRSDAPKEARAAGLGQRMVSWVGRLAGAGRAVPKDSTSAPDQPSADRSHLLHRVPSGDGVYSASNIVAERTDRLRGPMTRPLIDTALRGTGIAPEAVIARIAAGADSAALEDQWRREDFACIAAQNGLDPAQPKTADRLWARLDRIHGEIGTALVRAGVLREDGAAGRAHDFHADAVSVEARCRTIREELRDQGMGTARIADLADDVAGWASREIAREQRDWLAGHPDLPASPSAIYREQANGRTTITDPAFADRIEDMASRVTGLEDGSDDVAQAAARAFQAMYTGKRGETDMPEHLAWGLGETVATVCAIRAAERASVSEVRADREAYAPTAREDALLAARVAERHETERADAATDAPRAGEDLHPEIVRVVVLGREDSTVRPFASEAGGARYRELIEDHLDDWQVDALLRGDADALDGILPDRMDCLYAAKAYLQSDPAMEHGPALDRVVDEIVDREIDAERLAHGRGERRGLTH